ncbi:MAG: ATP-binding protein [Candidatus Omnitrophota bacterium]
MMDRYFFHGTIDQIDDENIKLREEVQNTEKLKAVATLAAGMAHEIKNPLTSIKTFTEFLDKKGADPVFRDKFKDIVGKEVDRINYIVKQLLDFSKPKDLLLADTDVNKLLQETLDLMSENLLKRGIRAVKRYAPLPHARVDASKMKQVFLNLFMNALDAMPSGGTITVETANEASGGILIKISDTGCGIEKKDLPHIFDPFFTKKDAGTGLGLSVVHGIVEKHGGNISVSSIPGKGSEFRIALLLDDRSQKV